MISQSIDLHMDWFAEHLREEDDVPSKAVRGRFPSATSDCIKTPLEALLVTSFNLLFAKFLGCVVSVQLSFAGISEDEVSVQIE